MTTRPGANRVFILGAGASAACGVPVVNRFHRAIEDSKFNNSEPFKLFKKGLVALRQVYAKGRLDTMNIEEVLGALELAALCDVELVENVGTYSIVEAARRVIGDVISERAGVGGQWQSQQNQRGSTRYSVQRLSPLRGYDQLVRQTRGGKFITFNQDLLLEYALFDAGIDFYYPGVEIEEQGSEVIKLHGSLNWEEQPDGSIALAGNIRDYFDRTKKQWLGTSVTTKPTEPFRFPSYENPFIVPPSWAKYSYYQPLRAVWSAAVKALQGAREIFVIGYSLPPSDYFFRHLFAIGTISDERIRRFCVVDPDIRNTRSRYESILGVESSKVFQPKEALFQDLDASDLAPLTG